MFLAFFITALPPVRARFYEVFRWTHWLFLPAIIFSALRELPMTQ